MHWICSFFVKFWQCCFCSNVCTKCLKSVEVLSFVDDVANAFVDDGRFSAFFDELWLTPWRCGCCQHTVLNCSIWITILRILRIRAVRIASLGESWLWHLRWNAVSSACTGNCMKNCSPGVALPRFEWYICGCCGEFPHPLFRLGLNTTWIGSQCMSACWLRPLYADARLLPASLLSLSWLAEVIRCQFLDGIFESCLLKILNQLN